MTDVIHEPRLRDNKKNNVVYGQGYLYVPVRPRPANKLCPLNFSISTCINFHLKNKTKKFTTCQYHKHWTKIFHLSVCYQKRFAKNLFSTNFASPKAVAPQGHGLIGLKHKVALFMAFMLPIHLIATSLLVCSTI